MHVLNIRVVKEKNIDEAIWRVENSYDNDESLTSDNYYTICGVLDMSRDKYVVIDKERDWNMFNCCKDVVKEVLEYANEKTYKQLKSELETAMKKKQWSRVYEVSEELEDIEPIIQGGFKFDKDNITEFAPWKVDTFSITDMRYLGGEGKTYAVVVDMHC
jgi:hypothetical protein